MAGAVDVHDATVVVGGYFSEGGGNKRPAIVFYANGSQGTLWKSSTTATTGLDAALCSFDNGLIFADPAEQKIMWYDGSTGAISSIGSYTKNSFAQFSACK